MIDVVTVGAGGGSVAWLSPEGTLKVGPRSAGADPGPLCYGRGGTEVTVTDAHVVLGRIPPHLLGGEIPLDVDAAAAGLRTLADGLGLTVEACAVGILEISAWNQANALRQVTVKRGLDVRDFVLTTFGGSGPLLLCRLMDVLGVPTVLVPPDPGNVSAFGLLTVDVRNDVVRTHVALADRLSAHEVAGLYDELAAEASQALAAEGFGEEERVLVRSADLRYLGQAFEVRVPVPDGGVDAGLLAEVAGRFHAEHRALYGYDFEGDAAQQVEWVNLRVTGIGPIARPEIRRVGSRQGFETSVVELVETSSTNGSRQARPPEEARPARAATRPVCFDAGIGYVEAVIHQRGDLAPGVRVAGPAVVEEFGSTVPVHPGFVAQVDDFGNLLVTRS